MPTYILLTRFTDQGIRNVKDTVKRANAFKELAKSKGATVKEVYWTLGQYDTINIVDAPDEAVATALALGLAKLGNVSLQTLRAFSQTEVEHILSKVA
jgi:uncharacterized protein with GYD domain